MNVVQCRSGNADFQAQDLSRPIDPRQTDSGIQGGRHFPVNVKTTQPEAGIIFIGEFHALWRMLEPLNRKALLVQAVQGFAADVAHAAWVRLNAVVTHLVKVADNVGVTCDAVDHFLHPLAELLDQVHLLKQARPWRTVKGRSITNGKQNFLLLQISGRWPMKPIGQRVDDLQELHSIGQIFPGFVIWHQLAGKANVAFALLFG